MAKKRLSDEDFLATFHAVGENGAALAKEVGVSPQAVYKRLRKLGVEVNPAGRGRRPPKRGGKAAVVVDATLHGSPEFKSGAVEATKSLLAIDRLVSCLSTVDAMVDRVNKEVEAQGGKYRPYQVDQMLKLLRESRATVESIHNIKKDLFDMHGVQTFMEAVVRVMEAYDPDAQAKIFDELARLGREEQVAVIGGGGK